MTFLLFKKCCFCVDLRAASFLIGYLMLTLHACTLIVTSVRLPSSHSTIVHHHGVANEDISFHRLTSIVSIMILVFEILLSIALIVGLHKRLDQHVEMFYTGSFAFLIMGIILFSVVLLRYAKQLGTIAWVLVAVEIVMKLILIYFLSVIRSYYYQMKNETKDDQESLDARETAKKYFARTKPVLISSKP